MNEPLAPKALFNKAINLIGSGKAVEAVALCRESIERSPRDVTMTALLGATLLKLRDAKEAEKYLRRAIELAPSFAKPHEDLGYLLVSAGRHGEAIEILEKATRLDPKSEDAFISLGRALSMAGRGDDADAAFEAAFELNPRKKRLAIAAEHHKAGRFDKAEQEYRDVLREYPNDVDAMRFLAGVLTNRSENEEAEVLLRSVVASAPDFTLAYLDLGRLMLEQLRYREAVEQFSRAIELEPGSARAYYNLAAAQAPLGRTFDALGSYQRAIDLRPRHAGAMLGLGHTLKTVGKQDESIAAYRKCIELRPDNGEAYWSLANLKTYKFSDADIAEMQERVRHADKLSDQSLVNFLFALAKAHEDKADFAAAWDYYVQGNAKQRTLEYYDPVATEVTNDGIIDVFNEEFMAARAGQGNPDDAPIFVVGLPRSGSTLIEQILASHSMVEGTSELPYLGRVATSLNRNRADGINFPHAVRELDAEHLRSLGTDYLEWAATHRSDGLPHFVDKMPNNFATVGFLKLILPNAKVIDARRYPLDSTLSCFRQLFAKGQTFVYDLEDIGEYFLEYQRMMDHWHEVIPGQVLTVQYEDMVTDFDAQVRRLLDYCGLPFEESCVRFYETDRPVRTASSEQVRQPVYTKSVHFWRNYEASLEQLIDVLEPVLPRYAQYEDINR